MNAKSWTVLLFLWKMISCHRWWKRHNVFPLIKQCACALAVPVWVFFRGSKIQTITQSQDQHTAAGKCGTLAHGDDATGRQPLLSGAPAARCSRCSLIHSRRLKNKPDWESLLCCRLFAFVWEWVAFFFDWSPSPHQHQQQPKKQINKRAPK